MNKPIENKMLMQLQGMEGWCSATKALALFSHVLEHKPVICVEIGVFGGQSLLPIAYGLRENGCGTVFGIDPWSASEAIVDVANPADVEWWGKKVDLEAIYAGCLKAIDEAKLGKYIHLYSETSRAVAMTWRLPIELLHIDGSHSEWSSTSDVCLWLPFLASGGFVFMDDVNWVSTNTAVRFVEKFCKKIGETITEKSTFAIYRKNGKSPGT